MADEEAQRSDPHESEPEQHGTAGTERPDEPDLTEEPDEKIGHIAYDTWHTPANRLV